MYSKAGEWGDGGRGYTNLSSDALRGFCYADQMPSALSVVTLRVRLNGQDLTNYAAEFGQDGDV